jgi:hypothetical protein
VKGKPKPWGLAISSAFLVTVLGPLPQAEAGLEAACVIGSATANCQAYSPQEIYNLYGTTTNGTYRLSVNGNSTEVFMYMNRSNSDNGGWVLLMKGLRGSTNFGYSSNLFTSNTSTLATTSLTNDVSTDAKFSVFNNLQVRKLLAVFKDATNGTLSGGGDIASNSFGGHTWMETLGSSATAQTTLSTATNLATNSYTNVRFPLYRASNSVSATQVFSYQNGYAQYGFSQSSCSGKAMRWGIAWNNENDFGSCDGYVGIGLESHSPGDQVTWTGTGMFTSESGQGKGNTGFQIWGKLNDPNISAPQNLSVSQASASSMTASWQAPSSGSATEYVLQYKLTSDSGWSGSTTRRVTSPGASPSVTVSGLGSGPYDFRVWARNSANSQTSSSAGERLNVALDTTNPVITGPSSATGLTSSISISENTTTVHTFTANETVTWSKSGADASFFSITAGGVLTISSRNFESAADSDANNVYVVAISATDNSGNSSTQTTSVTITNVNEAPSISTNGSLATHTISQAENGSAITTYSGSDVDAGTTLTWSISGTDAADFSINSGTGVLAFALNPDFEAPLDSDTNNSYVLIVTLSDGSLTDTQTVTISITNANEFAQISTPTVSGDVNKGVTKTVTVTLNVAGKVRFFVGGKRISGCLSRTTSGSYPNFTATCSWKPPVSGRQFLTATVTPTDNTFSGSTSARGEVFVLKRAGAR